jgi:AcrR family transcriptional regulator
LTTNADDAPVKRILDAATQCFLADGVGKTGMREVARSAGVARSTLYRHFPSRNDVLVAVVKQEMEAADRAIRRQLQGIDDPAAFIVEGLIVATREIPRRPILNAVFVSDEDGRARRTVWNSRLIVEFGEQLMASVIVPAQAAGVLQDRVAPGVLVEWVYRVLLSLLTLPSNWIEDDDGLRTTLHALLVPVLLHQEL